MRNNPARLAELRRSLILDSSPEKAYDDIARLLASSLEVPIAIVNFLDDGRDWFKACIGFPVTESPAATSFCETFFHTPNDVIVVEDTRESALFSKHPMVTGEPFVRFYAAARLSIGGHTLGTLCAYDMKPHKISADQIKQLQTLTLAVVELLEKRNKSLPA
ncbi:MAG: GAF domain-containing protein [Pseudomonadota bacterium]